VSEGRSSETRSGGGFGPVGPRGARRGQQHIGPPGLVGTGEKAKHFWPSFKRLMGRFRPERALLILVIALAVMSVAAQVGAPQILKRATNDIFAGAMSRQIDAQQEAIGLSPDSWSKEEVVGQLEAVGKTDLASMLSGMDLRPGQGIDFGEVGRTLLIVTAVYLMSALFAWVQAYLTAGIVQRTVYRLRREVDLKIARLPLKFFDSHARGDVLSRLTNDIDNIQQAMQQVLTQIITAFLTLIGVLAMMFWISWRLASISLVVLPVSATLAAFIAKRSQKQFGLQWDRTGDLNGHMEEMYTGHNIVKIFGRQREAIDAFDRHNRGVSQASFKAQFISGIIMPVTMLVSNLNFVAVCVLGGLRVANGTMTLGDVQAFIQYVQQFGQPIAQTASVANVLQSAVASVERVFEMLDEAEESADPVRATVLAEVKGHIALKDLSFRYLPDTPLIDDLDLEVEPGQTVAIVGPTGAGKTTLVNLLMRFYEIDQGSITIDGVDTRTMTRDGVRRLFGMVLQDAWLFSGTIRENIAYGREHATEEAIRAAAEAAHVDHFVRTLPDGYDAVVGDDSTNISQGERQLITIVRAFLADPQILILDEATSSVDTRTEVLIQRAMERLLKGRTSFVIAHRLSTIRDADVILVMNEGSIVEQGTHHELLCRRGFYYDLYNSQFAEAIAEAC
jgi:ATP-binding cassette subfamily B multidrug efflux pump